jgi:MFS family permease
MPPERQAASSTALLPIMAAVFMAFAVIGLAIPVLPLHVHQGLGLGTSLVGLVAGSQFAAAILSRVWAGRDADIRGAKHAVIAGLFIAAAAGVRRAVHRRRSRGSLLRIPELRCHTRDLRGHSTVWPRPSRRHQPL